MHNALIAIVGSGQTGVNAAVSVREHGHTGRILLIGEEAHRPYERPPLSKDALLAEAPSPSFFFTEQRLTNLAIELAPSTRVTQIEPSDRRLLFADGGGTAYDTLLIATGGRARRLSVPGAERVLYLRTLEDAAQIRARLQPGVRVACIGAGVIGLEIASSARARGCAVTVIEAGPTVMGRCLPLDLASHMEGLHRVAGVEIRLESKLESIGPDHVVVDGERLPADVVVAGIGIERNTELAAEAGIACENGILVDELTHTNVDGIHAAGDIAAFWHPTLKRRLRLEAWRHAQNHGVAAGRTMAGRAVPYVDVPWFWSEQHGVNLQVAGLIDRGTATVFRGDATQPSFTYFHLDVSGAVVAACGINAPRDVRAAMALIEAAVPVDAARLADTTVPLQQIVASAKKAVAPAGALPLGPVPTEARPASPVKS